MIVSTADSKNTDLKRLSGKIELRNINFGYSPLEPPLLENFNLTVEPGRWVAIGSGKSTLSKIVTGLYQQWSGDILFDGVNRRDLPRNIITGSLAAVEALIKYFQIVVRLTTIFFFDIVSKKLRRFFKWQLQN